VSIDAIIGYAAAYDGAFPIEPMRKLLPRTHLEYRP
jgi:hypothetical protein